MPAMFLKANLKENPEKFHLNCKIIHNIYVTHHIGASTEQAQDAVAEETINIIKKFVHSGVIEHWVNRAKITDANYQLVVKHYDKPGVLASVLDVIRSGTHKY